MVGRFLWFGGFSGRLKRRASRFGYDKRRGEGVAENERARKGKDGLSEMGLGSRAGFARVPRVWEPRAD
jgi:hypothetical protein